MLWATFELTFPKEKASKCDAAAEADASQQFESYSAQLYYMITGFDYVTTSPDGGDLRFGRRVQRGKA